MNLITSGSARLHKENNCVSVKNASPFKRHRNLRQFFFAVKLRGISWNAFNLQRKKKNNKKEVLVRTAAESEVLLAEMANEI